LSGLRTKSINGLFWSFSEVFGAKILQFAFGIAIARALSPEDYSIMAMIAIFLGLGNVLSESGFAWALIQKKNANDRDYSTVFWFNLLISLLIFGILFFFAEEIAEFYNQPILVNVTKVAAFTIVLNSLRIIHLTILSKKLNFKTQSIVRFISVIPTGILGVTLAMKGFEAWALVIQTLFSGVINTAGLWIAHKWRPKFIFDWKSFKELYNYGYKISLTSLTNTLFSKIYYPLIGKYFPAAQLGFYTKAAGFHWLLVMETARAYGKVTFPVFSSIKDEKERFHNMYIKIYVMLIFLVFPLMMLAILSSDDLILFFLTEKWSPVAPLLQIFLFEGFYYAVYLLNMNYFNAIGRSDIQLKLETIKKVLIVASIFVAFNHGIEALIIGQVLSLFIAFVISTIQFHRHFNISFYLIISRIMPTVIITLVCFALNFLFGEYFNYYALWLKLIFRAAFVGTVYITLSYMFNFNSFREFVLLFAKHLPKKIKLIFKIL